MKSISKIVLRPVTDSDGFFLFTLYRTTREEEVAGWPDDTKNWFFKMQFEAFSASYGNRPEYCDQVIMMDTMPIGRLITRKTVEEIYGVDIAILPEHRSKGFGRHIVQDLLQEAASKQIPFRCQVWKTNVMARRLYESLGLIATGETATHFLMEKMYIPKP